MTRIAVFAVAVSGMALGLVIGALVGLSTSPTVGVLLPLLFGLVGGGSGAFFAIGPSDKRPHLLRVSALATFLTTLSAGTLFGLWRGISFRLDSPNWSLVGLRLDSDFPPPTSSVADTIEWISLDARLHQLGLSIKQRSVLLRDLKTEPPVYISTSAFLSELERAAGLVQSALSSNQTEAVDGFDAASALDLLLDIASRQSNLQPEAFWNILDEIHQGVHDLFVESTMNPELFATDAQSALLEARVRLSALIHSLQNTESPVERANNRLEELLLSTSSQQLASTAAIAQSPGRGIASDPSN